MDFNIHVAKVIHLFGLEIWITESMVNSWYICSIIVIVAFIINRAIRKPQMVPAGVQNVIEFIIESLGGLVRSTMGNVGNGFTWFYGSMFTYILFFNLSGLFWGPNIIPSTPGHKEFPITFMRPPTADLAVTLSLALMTFLMIQGFSIKSKGVLKYLKGFGEPIVFMAPLNIIGELAFPVSLSFRMFGNILGGTIIMGLFYNLPWFLLLGIPVALHSYFDIFAGVLQTFVFVMLSMTFVSNAID